MFLDKILILKFVKFCIVGFSGMVVDFGTTFICKEWLKFNKYLSNSMGFILAASSNYLLNRIWTFSSSNPEIMSEYIRFFLISIAGLILNNLVVYIFHGRRKFNFYLTKLGATFIVTLWNFTMNYLFTF